MLPTGTFNTINMNTQWVEAVHLQRVTQRSKLGLGHINRNKKSCKVRVLDKKQYTKNENVPSLFYIL